MLKPARTDDWFAFPRRYEPDQVPGFTLSPPPANTPSDSTAIVWEAVRWSSVRFRTLYDVFEAQRRDLKLPFESLQERRKKLTAADAP